MEEGGKQKLTREQKIGAGLLGIFVLFGFGMTVYGMVESIKRPIEWNQVRALKDAEKFRKDFIAQEFRDDVLRDTDGDGLADRDELEKYKTSPYLEDSDSDGIKDGDEIKAGKNPNCPENQECSISIGGADFQSSGNEEFSQNDLYSFLRLLGQQPSGALQVPIPQTLTAPPVPTALHAPIVPQAPAAEPPEANPTREFLLGLKSNPTLMRDFLVKNGIPQGSLDNLSNDNLEKLFEETLKQVGL